MPFAHAANRDVAIVGAGDVVRGRYLRGLTAQDGAVRLRADPILSIERRPDLPGDIRYVQIPVETSAALATIREQVPADRPIIIATPTPLHAPYALGLAASHKTLIIEKPTSASLQEHRALVETLRALRARWFPLGYYLLEKGLALLPLVSPAFRIEPFLRRLTPRTDQAALARLRSELGRLRRVTGCIFEGRGPVSSLAGREWLLQPESGGNTYDTLFHLISLLMVATEGPARIHGESPACAERYLPPVKGQLAGGQRAPGRVDTANLVWGEVGHTEFLLASAKEVAAASHQRWLLLDFDGGRVHLGLESNAMRVQTAQSELILRLTERTPYACQLSLVGEWLADPELSLPRDVTERALSLLQERPRSPIGVYSQGTPPDDLWARWHSRPG